MGLTRRSGGCLGFEEGEDGLDQARGRLPRLFLLGQRRRHSRRPEAALPHQAIQFRLHHLPHLFTAIIIIINNINISTTTITIIRRTAARLRASTSKSSGGCCSAQRSAGTAM
jgi:hypothetical protein